MTPQLLAVALLLTGADAPAPSPEMSPQDVVWAQLDALRENDKRGKDSGIATVFRFASPGNQEATGPLGHFVEIVKGPAYRPMIGHRVAGAGPMIVVDNLALQRVVIVAADGQAIEYEFRLSKDPGTRCWHTDGVVPVVPPPAPKPGNRVI